MNYYREALNMLYEYAGTVSYDGDTVEHDAIFNELMDRALDIATTLLSWGITDDSYAFYLAARRVVGDL